MSPLRALSPSFVVALALLTGCSSVPTYAPGSKLAGVETRRYTGVRHPVENRSQMEVVQRVISSKAQRDIAARRAKIYWDTLTEPDRTYLRGLGVTHVCVEVPAGRSHKGEKSVMMWDTQQQNFVGNEVFEVNQVPPDQSLLRMPDYVAICVLKYSA